MKFKEHSPYATPQPCTPKSMSLHLAHTLRTDNPVCSRLLCLSASHRGSLASSHLATFSTRICGRRCGTKPDHHSSRDTEHRQVHQHHQPLVHIVKLSRTLHHLRTPHKVESGRLLMMMLSFTRTRLSRLQVTTPGDCQHVSLRISLLQ